MYLDFDFIKGNEITPVSTHRILYLQVPEQIVSQIEQIFRPHHFNVISVLIFLNDDSEHISISSIIGFVRQFSNPESF